MKRSLWPWTFLLVACCMPWTGCGPTGRESPGERSTEKIRVVCTTTMIADLARELAGEDAEVIGIMKVGEDPHVYEVRPRDAQQIASAELILLNGLHLESTLLRTIENNARGKVVALAEDPRIQPLTGQRKVNGVATAPDPHCWFNVRHFQVYAERARDALCQADPRHAENYRRRALGYLRQLAELDAFVRQQIAEVPRDRRVIVTSHDAFAYYGEAYGIDVYAVIGINTEQQPKPQDVVRLEQLVRDRGVKALFIETSVSKTLNDLVQRIAGNTGAKVGGALYSDSLGAAGSGADTYVGMVQKNTRTIVEALR